MRRSRATFRRSREREKVASQRRVAVLCAPVFVGAAIARAHQAQGSALVAIDRADCARLPRRVSRLRDRIVAQAVDHHGHQRTESSRRTGHTEDRVSRRRRRRRHAAPTQGWRRNSARARPSYWGSAAISAPSRRPRAQQPIPWPRSPTCRGSNIQRRCIERARADVVVVGRCLANLVGSWPR
jgi:hypothetical protein